MPQTKHFCHFLKKRAEENARTEMRARGRAREKEEYERGARPCKHGLTFDSCAYCTGVKIHFDEHERPGSSESPAFDPRSHAVPQLPPEILKRLQRLQS